MGSLAAPLYGENNGSYTNMQVTGNITLADKSMYTTCPVASGNYN